MNTPNPLAPQGSLLEQKARSKPTLPVFFFILLGIHVVVIGGLLMVGCKKEDQLAKATPTNAPATSELPPLDTNALYQPVPLSNQIVAPATNVGVTPPPAVEPTTPAPAPAASTEYVVVKNDSFTIIGKKFGVSAGAIAKANPGTSSSKLKVGQKLQIPAGAGAASATPAVAEETKGAGSSTYTVKAGDNLTKIATAHGTTAKAIKSANNLKTDRINVGQKLKLPMAKSPAAKSETALAPAPITSTNYATPLPTVSPTSAKR